MDPVEQTTPRRQFIWKWGVPAAVGALLLMWLSHTPEGLLGKADAIGYAVCHQIDVRSFHLGSRRLPLCARCTGMYLGAMAGLVYQAVISRKRGGMPPRSVLVILGIFGFAFAVDGANSYLHLFPNAPGLYEPQNWLRTLTGSGMGIVISALLFPAFNQTVWKDWHPSPALPGLGSLAGLAVGVLLIDLLVFTENSMVLYPLALISAAGVLVLLTMVYSMIWLMVLRKENGFLKFYQLVYPLMGGFLIGLAQIAALDMLRYALTGTWDGFHLG